jgi:iron complex outermembrane receptor protein
MLAAASAGWAQSDLSEASLEQLINIKVTSVSKKEQKLFRAAAAIYVITQEDIRRSGAMDVPTLLRMAPGVYVARIDANAWAISIRGFSARYSNKVLVLIDGRTVYTPSFSGVFWDHQDLPLEDIDRIEVIRGPGATVWGANAVDGVISIITKSAQATQGGLVTAAGGSELNALGMVRYGGKIGGHGWYRAFGKAFQFGNQELQAAGQAKDGWNRMQGGFRTDWELSERDSLTVEGDLFSNHESQTRRNSFVDVLPFDTPFTEKFTAHGGHLLGRWDRTFSGGSDVKVQAYFDTYRRTDLGVPEAMDSMDVDFQHHFAFGSRHDIVWGLGYRVTSSGLSPGHMIAFTPPQRTDSLFSTFIQDEIRITDSLWFTVGSKFEHNAYTGFEYEPSVRLAWTPSPRHTVWAAAARAIRQPSRVDTALIADLVAFPLGDGSLQVIRLQGNPEFQAEQVRDYEIGYRTQLSRGLSLDLATFFSSFRRLESVDPGLPYLVVSPPPPQRVLPWIYGNRGRVRNHGAELSANWNATSRWRISPGYSFIHMNNIQAANSRPDTPPSRGDTPKHMFQVRSLLNLTKNWDFDNTIYYAHRLPDGNIPSRVRLDSRIAWRATESMEFSVVGQNLLRPRRLEFGDSFAVVGTQVERSVYGKMTWRF